MGLQYYTLMSTSFHANNAQAGMDGNVKRPFSGSVNRFCCITAPCQTSSNGLTLSSIQERSWAKRKVLVSNISMN